MPDAGDIRYYNARGAYRLQRFNGEKWVSVSPPRRDESVYHAYCGGKLQLVEDSSDGLQDLRCAKCLEYIAYIDKAADNGRAMDKL